MEPVCREEEVKGKRLVRKRLDDGRTVAVVEAADGSYLAFEDRCPHKGAPLSAGKVHDGVVVCPWHGFRFDLRTGKAVGLESIMHLKVLEVVVRDGVLYVSP